MNELSPVAEANDMELVSTMWGEERQRNEPALTMRRRNSYAL